MAEKSTIAKAIAQVSDICAAAAGDIHTAHLNMKGTEFDTMHKKVLLKYYEALDDDYDSLAEFAACYGFVCQNKNEAASRVGWQSFNGMVNRSAAVDVCNEVLNSVTDKMKDLYRALNRIDDCPIAIGVANWLQGRLEYWAKEVFYFNARRTE
jgi:DNA-binding ferritin-like protein